MGVSRTAALLGAALLVLSCVDQTASCYRKGAEIPKLLTSLTDKIQVEEPNLQCQVGDERACHKSCNKFPKEITEEYKFKTGICFIGRRLGAVDQIKFQCACFSICDTTLLECGMSHAQEAAWDELKKSLSFTLKGNKKRGGQQSRQGRRRRRRSLKKPGRPHSLTMYHNAKSRKWAFIRNSATPTD